MNCLCCGKTLTDNTNNSGWHKSCIQNFFGTSTLPIIDISDKTLELNIIENVNKGLTVPGVQKKISLNLVSKNKKKRLTIVDYITGYILKLQTNEYRFLPEAEQLVMSMADECGIKTVPHALISDNNSYVYITKRIDRIIKKDSIKKLAMEDFCQLSLRSTQDKYKGSYERCSKIISSYSSQKMLDMAEFFIRLVFSFITGNSDMHLKNFSLIEKIDESNNYVLSPAYDMLPVNIVSDDKEEFALQLNGKKKNIRRNDFLEFADYCNINIRAATKMIEELKSKKEKLINMCNNSLLPDDMKKTFSSLIETRCKVL